MKNPNPTSTLSTLHIIIIIISLGESCRAFVTNKSRTHTHTHARSWYQDPLIQTSSWLNARQVLHDAWNASSPNLNIQNASLSRRLFNYSRRLDVFGAQCKYKPW